MRCEPGCGCGRHRKRVTPLLERLLSKVEPGWGGCWIFTGTISKQTGYGSLGVTEGDGQSRMRSAHRVSYELLVGKIADGLQLDHICRVRRCINPQHLEPVTPRENIRRSPFTIASINAAKSHCPHGHEYTPENTVIHTNSRRNGHRALQRVCRICRNARSLARYVAKKQESRGGAATPTPGEGPSHRSQEIDPR